ncbi:MAG: hypothetical protein J5495_03905 [Bacteroidales bacterium]|nr:hypothetical protein [Bacteroidales bacterium]
MRSGLWNIILFVLIFILQVLICNYVDLGAYIYICLLPLLIINIPMKLDIRLTMLIGFALGLLLDFFANGVLGLNAAAATTLAAFKGPLFQKTINKEHRYNIEVPSMRNVSVINYIIYLTMCTAIYLVTYMLLECVSLRPFLFILIRILISLAVNVALMAIISNSIMDRE